MLNSIEKDLKVCKFNKDKRYGISYTLFRILEKLSHNEWKKHNTQIWKLIDICDQISYE